MRLNTFLIEYLGCLSELNVSYCILRNYQGLPEVNVSNDIDILIQPEDLDIALHALLTMRNIRVTNYLRRTYVASTFVEGVSWGDGYRAIEIDFVTSLSWKGIEFLSVADVLNKRIIIDGKPEIIKIPRKEHEAIITLFSSYLLSGFIKEKYKAFVRDVFIKDEERIINFLTDILGKNISRRLFNLIIHEKYKMAIRLLPFVRLKILSVNFLCQPLLTISNLYQYFKQELIIRFYPRHLQIICFLGPDGAGKSSVIAGLEKMLINTTKQIKIRHLKPTLFWGNRVKERGVVTAPQSKPSRSRFFSTVKLIIWLIEAWIDYFWNVPKNSTLMMYDRYFHDILVDPKRYRYGASARLVEFIGKLIPQPDFFIILDASVKVVLSRKQEVTLDEIYRQRDAYQQLSTQVMNSVVVDAELPLQDVCEYTYNVIVDSLSNKTSKRIKDGEK